MNNGIFYLTAVYSYLLIKYTFTLNVSVVKQYTQVENAIKYKTFKKNKCVILSKNICCGT